MTTTPSTPGAAEPTLTVGDLARASGVATSAVRFYDNYGLIPSTRTTGNQRRFYEVAACLIKVIHVAQRVGLSVAEIHDLLADLPDHCHLNIEHFEYLRRRLEDEVHNRMQALRKAFDDLTSDQKLCQLPTR